MQMHFFRTLILTLTLATTYALAAEAPLSPKFSIDFNYIGVEEGLSQSTVTSVVEDKDGYLWFGTLNGLNRFDGSEIKHFYKQSNSGLASSFIQSLAVINDELFVGTDSGLQKYNPAQEKFTFSNLNHEPIWSITLLNGETYLGLTDGFAIYDVENDRVKNYYRNKKLNSVKQISAESNRLFIRNHDGNVYVLDDINSNDASLYLEKTKDLLSVKDRALFIIEDKVKTTNNDTVLNADAITYFNENLLYVNKGTIGYRTGPEFENYTEVGHNNLLNEIDNLKFYIGENYISIINNNHGIYLLNKNKIQTKNLIDFSKPIWSTSKWNDLAIIGDDTETVKFLDKNLNIVNEINVGLSGPKIIITDPNSHVVFIGTASGIFKYEDENLSFFDSEVITSGLISNERLLVTTSNYEIVSYDIQSGLKQASHTVGKDQQLLDIAIMRDHIIVAHQSGLSMLSNNLKEIQELFTGEIVFSLNVNADVLLFSTASGLYKYYLGNIEKVIHSENPIYAVDTTPNKAILATSIGRYYSVSDDKVLTFNNEFGSQIEYNTQSIVSFDSFSLAGGMGGLSFIPANLHDKFKTKKTTPVLTNLSIFNNPIATGTEYLPSALAYVKSLSLKYSDYPFSIKFKSPSTALNNVNYYYRLKGLSDDWLSSKGGNEATYTNLSPGDYFFETYAVNPVTNNPSDIVSLKIAITPPWWMSLEAKIAYALIVLLITSGIIKAALRRREVQRQIAISEERLKLSLWGSGDEMWDWDIETGKIYRSNIWGSLEFPKDGHRSGKDDEESNIHPQDQERVREALNRHFYGETDHFEAAYRVKGKDGHWVWILDRAKIVERDDSENALRMTGTIKNINNFKQAEEQLRLFERAIENISEGMFILDNEFRFVEVNEACCDICLMDKDSFIGTQLQFSCYPDAYSEQVRIILRQQGRWSAEVESRRGDNTTFLMELTVDAIYDEQGTLSHFVGVFSDISRRKQQEEELRKLTNNDLLTGLPNRSNLQVSLNNLVKKDTHHTLMVLDLDNFKKINDSLGHQVGDELLQLVSKRMSAALPGHTSLYRLGGDEFAVLLDKDPDIGSAAAIAKGLVDAFIAPFELAGEKLVVGVSIGIVLYPEDEQNEQALLRKADIAMYHAKSAGGNRYQFYSESLNRNALRQLEVENLIRDGLRDDLFEVYYQPKVDLRNSRMAGMEALVRLNHPTQGLIPPSEFIPLAEETGLIVEIGDLVMRKACFAAQRWREQGLFDGRVAVNLSSRQFALTDLQQRIESILRLTKLPAANLELEITEGTVIKQPEKAIKVMQQLAKMGVSLALDDFGTGYSSLSYLKRFPIHTLKIDKAFVDDIDKSDRDLKMVDSIITIAHNMGLTVVGEGVEVPSQLNILRALKCEEVQGYIYSKAVPEAEFTTLLKQDMGEFLNQKYNQR